MNRTFVASEGEPWEHWASERAHAGVMEMSSIVKGNWRTTTKKYIKE